MRNIAVGATPVASTGTGSFPEVAALLGLDILADISREWVTTRADSVWPARYRDGSSNTATRLTPLLADVHDNDGLAQVGEWIVDCADGEELIARFGDGADHEA